VTRALRSVFTLSWCGEANSFSVRKISSRALAADGFGSRRILSAISKELLCLELTESLTGAGFSILEPRRAAGARMPLRAKKGFS
jgi:hypothetical protein